MSEEKPEFTTSPTSSNSTIASVTAASLGDDCVIPSLRFPQKLWRIVNECRTGAISWGPDGLSLVLNYKAFQEEYLGGDSSVFKTTNIASFIRQLNLYGFRKVTSHNRELFCSATGGLVHVDQDVHEFVHEYFKEGRLDLLSRVCRKTGVKKSSAQKQQGAGKQQPAKEQQAVKATGMSRLQMCQIALTKALEQATRQYRKEKFWLQLSQDNVPKDALRPKYKTETLESNIQIIFQDFSEVQAEENLPMIDVSTIENVIGYEDKIQWEEVFTLPVEHSVSITVPN